MGRKIAANLAFPSDCCLMLPVLWPQSIQALNLFKGQGQLAESLLMLDFFTEVPVWVFNLNLLTGNIMKKTGCHEPIVGFAMQR